MVQQKNAKRQSQAKQRGASKEAEPTPNIIVDEPLVVPARATYYATNRTWMWVGVAVISLIIVFLWGWSLKSQILSINWERSPEKQLIEKTKTNWQQAFATTPNNGAQFQEVKEQLVSALQQMTATSSSATSASSSLTNTASSTQK